MRIKVTKEQLEKIMKIIGEDSVRTIDSEHIKESNGNSGTKNNRNEHSNMGEQNNNTDKDQTKDIKTEELEIEPSKIIIQEPEPKTEQYKCVVCGRVFEYPKGEYPDKCPSCGCKWR